MILDRNISLLVVLIFRQASFSLSQTLSSAATTTGDVTTQAKDDGSADLNWSTLIAAAGSLATCLTLFLAFMYFMIPHKRERRKRNTEHMLTSAGSGLFSKRSMHAKTVEQIIGESKQGCCSWYCMCLCWLSSSRYNIDLAFADQQGQTIAHHGALRDLLAPLEELLFKKGVNGADLMRLRTATNARGYIPLHLAIENRAFASVRCYVHSALPIPNLLENMRMRRVTGQELQEIFSRSLQTFDKGYSVLHSLALHEWDSPELLVRLCSLFDLTEQVVVGNQRAFFSTIYSTDLEGDTFIHLAFKRRNMRLIRFLAQDRHFLNMYFLRPCRFHGKRGIARGYLLGTNIQAKISLFREMGVDAQMVEEAMLLGFQRDPEVKRILWDEILSIWGWEAVSQTGAPLQNPLPDRLSVQEKDVINRWVTYYITCVVHELNGINAPDGSPSFRLWPRPEVIILLASLSPDMCGQMAIWEKDPITDMVSSLFHFNTGSLSPLRIRIDFLYAADAAYPYQTLHFVTDLRGEMIDFNPSQHTKYHVYDDDVSFDGLVTRRNNDGMSPLDLAMRNDAIKYHEFSELLEMGLFPAFLCDVRSTYDQAAGRCSDKVVLNGQPLGLASLSFFSDLSREKLDRLGVYIQANKGDRPVPVFYP